MTAANQTPPLAASIGRKWGLTLFLSVLLLPLAAEVLLKLGIAWPCAFKMITGLPCATCGGTRALAALGRLDLLSALRFNPMVACAAIVLVFLPFVRYRPNPKVFWPFFWTFVGLNWLYLIFFLPP